jgi:hypothetical protein
VVAAVARSIGIPGQVAALSLAESVERMGPIAEAFALDQRVTAARARDQLGWRPAHTDPLAELAEG